MTSAAHFLEVLSLEAAVADPDRAAEEYDFWLESDCGRSNSVTTKDLTVWPKSFTFQWKGDRCRMGCMYICICRIGSDVVQRVPFYGDNGDADTVAYKGTVIKLKLGM